MILYIYYILAKKLNEGVLLGLSELTLNNILTIIAMFLPPLVALQVSRMLQESKEKRQRKIEVFRTLMKTRASTLSPEHVEALNMIDVEFYGNEKRNRAVVEAWKSSLDRLNHLLSANMEAWEEKCELLEKVAISLN
ncbi:DUF6680 family protein [Propionispora hippei]|uniref:DUF6680 domain-containing protein n=1 Tax=Propionispora hippei DSM 15287 TaxID=1123003 RepID=A0A1M6LRH8_9FIRM|nr:DUF6680 family protein [Propionispora hippei]SHJ73771.1 hypothetical protein SAMN02745170_03207 [Propionispora hippei DSM 15287]